jgi:hypothetical protein
MHQRRSRRFSLASSSLDMNGATTVVANSYTAAGC